jgi:hypothetical protein
VVTNVSQVNGANRPRSKLLINFSAAKTVGLKVPPTLIAGDDEVIE